MRDPSGHIAAVVERVAGAAERSGRRPADVRIVGVTKAVDDGLVEAAMAAGITHLGENRAEVLAQRARTFPSAHWHFLGGIQRNKVSHLDPAVLIHSVDREAEAAALQARAERDGRARDVLVQVNVSGERSKQGVAPEEMEPLLERLEAYPLVRARGSMFVAPLVQNPEDVRWMFTQARRLKERAGLEELSMGMSNDYEIAIEEGATIVRIGRALFGEVRA